MISQTRQPSSAQMSTANGAESPGTNAIHGTGTRRGPEGHEQFEVARAKPHRSGQVSPITPSRGTHRPLHGGRGPGGVLVQVLVARDSDRNTFQIENQVRLQTADDAQDPLAGPKPDSLG